MCRLPNFVVQLLTVFAGLLLLVMSMAFVMLPYSLSAHPGDKSVPPVARSFHAT
jgi:hypothetical protein